MLIGSISDEALVGTFTSVFSGKVTFQGKAESSQAVHFFLCL
jgi:hypothetical protein